MPILILLKFLLDINQNFSIDKSITCKNIRSKRFSYIISKINLIRLFILPLNTLFESRNIKLARFSYFFFTI